MAATERKSALRLKLGQTHAGGADEAEEDAFQTDRSPLRALRLALARTSRQVLGLRMDVIGATQSALPQEELPALLPDDQLLMLLDGAQGATAALALDRTAVAAITRHQTTGAVASDPPALRAFTDTDAALSAPLIEATLAAATALADGGCDRAGLDEFQFGARVADGKSLALSLRGDSFRVFELRLDIEAGLLQSALTLVVPERRQGDGDAIVAGVDGQGDACSAQVRGPSLGDAALNAPVQLNAVLCRLRLGFDRLAAMKVGDVLPLGGYRVDRTELLSGSGRIVATGRLGRVEGLRAVRVNETASPDPSFALSGAQEEIPARLVGIGGEAEGRPVPEEGASSLDQMNPDEAMARISELAGLDLENEAGRLEHVD